MADLGIAYVLLRFPRLTETFVAEEIRHIQKMGIELRVYSLLPSRDQLVPPAAQQILPLVTHVPGALSSSLWAAQVYYLFRAPTQYLSLLSRILREPAPLLSFRLKRFYIFLKGVWLARELQHRPKGLVHTHFAWLSGIAGIVAKELLDLPFTVTAHAYDIYSEKNDLLRLVSGSADRIITISETNKRVILRMNPDLPPSKVHVLHCGIDLERFQPIPHEHSRKSLQIISVGSLLAKKGHEYLIRACAELRQANVDFQCTIVGGGNLQQQLQDLIGELSLQGRVTLCGPRPHNWVCDRLAASDLFVLACVTEKAGGRDGIPVAIMEAMATRVPVISTAVSGIPELVRNEETGLLVPERDARALAAAILRIADDKPMRQKLVDNALDLVRREYNIVSNTSKLVALFEQSVRSTQLQTGGSV